MMTVKQDDGTWATTPVYIGMGDVTLPSESHSHEWKGASPWGPKEEDQIGPGQMRLERCSCGGTRVRIAPEGVALPE